jgi:hypothetical protein
MSADSSRLASRLRELLRSTPAPAGARDEARPLAGTARDAVPEPASADSPGPARELRYVLDAVVGASNETPTGCVVTDRHYDLDLAHGAQAVSHYAGALERCLPALAVLAADPSAALTPRAARSGRLQWGGDPRLADDRPRAGAPTTGPLLFFDLETTGLSGGAGTLAFLVGCGYFEADGFHTRQFFLSGYEAEHELLESLTALTTRFNGLVTFNGRTFDVPLIETRYLFHRLDSPFRGMPHFDMLHPARKLWRRRSVGRPSHRERFMGGGAGEGASCALGALEEAILGVQRFDDVPGSEIPSRYFGYLRTGNMAPLTAVFEHNRLDLLSLAALTAIATQMAEEGPSGVPSPHEALALGQIYERLGRMDAADACFLRAAGLNNAPWDAGSVDGDIRAEALQRLAIQRRRQHRFDEAADAWRRILEAGASPAYVQEARCALAIYHEHRVRDLEAARRFAEHALESEQDPAGADALRHRLARLERKLGRAKPKWDGGASGKGGRDVS